MIVDLSQQPASLRGLVETAPPPGCGVIFYADEHYDLYPSPSVDLGFATFCRGGDCILFNRRYRFDQVIAVTDGPILAWRPGDALQTLVLQFPSDGNDNSERYYFFYEYGSHLSNGWYRYTPYA